MDSSAAPVSQDTGTQQIGSDNINTPGQNVDLSNYITKEHAGRITSDKYGEGRRKGFEEGRKAALEDAQRQSGIPAQTSDGLSNNQRVQQSNFSEDEINKRIEEKVKQELQGHRQQAEADRVIQDFAGRLGAATQEYPDIQKAFQSLNLDGANPAAQAFLIQAATSVDNTADLIMSWSENPLRMHEIISMATWNPVAAQRQLQNYAMSLKANKDAKKSYQKVNAPLSKIQSSNTGMDDGEPTVDDLASRPEFKR